jgi:hypothetical protein
MPTQRINKYPYRKWELAEIELVQRFAGKITLLNLKERLDALCYRSGWKARTIDSVRHRIKILAKQNQFICISPDGTYYTVTQIAGALGIRYETFERNILKDKEYAAILKPRVEATPESKRTYIHVSNLKRLFETYPAILNDFDPDMPWVVSVLMYESKKRKVET